MSTSTVPVVCHEDYAFLKYFLRAFSNPRIVLLSLIPMLASLAFPVGRMVQAIHQALAGYIPPCRLVLRYRGPVTAAQAYLLMQFL